MGCRSTPTDAIRYTLCVQLGCGAIKRMRASFLVLPPIDAYMKCDVGDAADSSPSLHAKHEISNHRLTMGGERVCVTIYLGLSEARSFPFRRKFKYNRTSLCDYSIFWLFFPVFKLRSPVVVVAILSFGFVRRRRSSIPAMLAKRWVHLRPHVYLLGIESRYMFLLKAENCNFIPFLLVAAFRSLLTFLVQLFLLWRVHDRTRLALVFRAANQRECVRVWAVRIGARTSVSV